MKITIDEIRQLSAAMFAETVAFRRHIHRHPELSFHEFETVNYLKSVFDSYSISYDSSFGPDTVVVPIAGDAFGPTIALRADMDALPIDEAVACDFRSEIPGVMHACGHDAHTASLLATTILLHKLKHRFAGRVVCIFQPGEELCPGGANILIQKGLLQKYHISAIVAQHVQSGLPTGTMMISDGYMMAATNELYVTFAGVGGHAAIPAQRSDTVMALAEFLHDVHNFQTHIPADQRCVVAFGKIVANGAVNVVPDTATATGTMRTFDEKLRNTIKAFLRSTADKNARLFKCTANVDIKDGYPSVYNDPQLTAAVKNAAMLYLPTKNIVDMPVKMTAEDFAFYSQKIPATFYRMGICGNGKGAAGQHSPNFDLDENLFHHSVGLMAFIALSLLENE